jgi:dienelactone hydrolase
MLSLATTFDKLGNWPGLLGNWPGETDAPVRKVARLAKKLLVEPHKIHGTEPKRLSLREVMSAAWEKVTFENDGLKLVGYLFKPFGSGPFPAVIYNHGSENLGRGPTYDNHLDDVPIDLDQVADDEAANDAVASAFGKIAKVLVPAGYVVFFPVRRGQGASQGDNIRKLVDNKATEEGEEAAGNLSMFIQETSHLSDQLAGLEVIKKLQYVDKDRLAVFGCSLGGIQTLLGAESGAGYRAAVAMSPGAETWHREVVRLRLEAAVRNIDRKITVLLIHPKKDVTLEPGYTLGQMFELLQKPYGLIIFPPYGTEGQQGHCFGGDGGEIWGAPVLTFLEWALRPPSDD